MYEQLKNKFMMQLKEKYGYNEANLKEVLFCLDLAAYNYDIRQKETQIVPYNHELPQLAKTFIVCIYYR